MQKKPYNLEVIPHCEDSTLLVTWEGDLTEYEVHYRSLKSSTWHRATGLKDGVGGFTRGENSQCSYILTDIEEGGYDVRVRGVYEDLTTNYVYCDPQVIVFCPENHCVNYLDLDKATCTFGHYRNSKEAIGIVDYGSDNIKSRHTKHTDPTETDPRTDGMLHTVPPDAVASIRLGNWDVGSEAESITYDITVDAEHQGILIVRYAIVFQDPSTHHGNNEELFKLEILDEKDSLIDNDCGVKNFSFTDAVNSGWHTTLDENVKWKDWSYVGLNLSNRAGENIKVRFTTTDCGLGAHFGYAYFTVDCINAYITTENCGEDSEIKCSAPAGFEYKWYNDQGDSVGEDQELKVLADRRQYKCVLTSKESPGCHFELYTVAGPRMPVPAYRYELSQSDCLNRLRITDNDSYVEVDNDSTSERCKDYKWVFRRLSDNDIATYEGVVTPPMQIYPSDGDSIEVTMTSYIGENNACDSTRVDTIVIPSITPRDSILQVRTCPEAPAKFKGEYFSRDTIVSRTYKTRYGCDSTITMQLKVAEVPFVTYIRDSICSDQSITVGGVQYSEPMDNAKIHTISVSGCDSVIYLTLIVNERLQATVDSMAFACADEERLSITFDIAAGAYDSLEIRFNTPELRDTVIYDKNVTDIVIPYPDTITPGHYQATLRFYQYCCGIYEETRDFDIRYRSSIVEQKWNDVLTLLSPKYNGGYQFTAFQWYKDDTPIPGKNQSYLYEDLDMNATYYVELTRTDGVVMTTCPIQPVYHEQQSAYPTIVNRGQRLPMYMERATTIWYYTISGQLYSTFTLPQGYTSLPTPDQIGSFIIKSVDAEGETQAQIMIVQ